MFPGSEGLCLSQMTRPAPGSRQTATGSVAAGKLHDDSLQAVNHPRHAIEVELIGFV